MKWYASLFSVLLSITAFAQKVSYETQIDELFAKAYEHLYVNKDSAYHYFKEIEDLAVENNDWATVFEALISSNRNAGAFYDLDKLGDNLNILDSLFLTHKTYLDTLPEKRLFINSLLYDKGNYFFQLNNYRSSRQTFGQIIESLEALPDSEMDEDLIDLLSVSYSFIAKMYTEEGKYALAQQYYEKNIRYILQKKPDDLASLNTNYSLLAELYAKKGQYETSNTYFNKALEFYLKDQSGINGIIATAHNLSKNYLSLSKTDSAQHYLKLAKDYLNDTHHFASFHHRVQAKLEQKMNRFELAVKELNLALQLERNKWKNAKNESMAQIYNEIGDLHASFGQHRSAVSNYNLGLDQIVDFSEDGTIALKLLKNKSLAMNTLNSRDNYKTTLETVNLGIKTLDSLKPTFRSQADQLFLIEDAFPLFEAGLEAAYQLYLTSNDDSLLNLAFQYSEKSKSVLLLEALLGAKATEFADIPADVLERESELKSEITHLEKQIKNSIGEKTEKQDALFNLKEEYRQLVRKLETDYKSYYDLKYNTATISILETQQDLAKTELLISYFYGNNAIYVISLGSNTKDMLKIPIDADFEASIKKAYRLLADPKTDVTALSKATHKIYVRLLEPILKSEDQKKLIIITDGLLNYIPFAALNTAPEDISYLAEKHAISYVNSATLLSELRQRHPKEHSVLAFAPSFDGTVSVSNADRGKLLPLPNNKKEVEQILTSFNGRSFIDNEATLLNFKSQLSSFGVVHLATHAIFDDAAPEYSYLAFSQNQNATENLLYVADLYNLKIDADLVTLSACESGLGDLNRGEGFMSLARGFFYSGAASIASTLWKINDASTTALMHGFYINLSKGDSKDVALQKAQVEFLNTNRQNGFSHPYYWSGFVISGNTVPLSFFNNWTWTLIGVIVVLVAIILYLRTRKRNP
ncbi:CHAT domain-containing tetratricopeptide repeat protein [Arenibacter sp. S6351L]|uniref:CHAT domain-containing protein n=1 Tax=Arenibacter sp. S6351L TaxID=2926407 RepID=UPI001FF5E1B9|nr:CHAT domain-containing tetratricopeptide repeat protein [Arenibacter sp. S6351L]MCK0136578.1 CHAT domain-containing protein [Arenibacter sp. S6351L]